MYLSDNEKRDIQKYIEAGKPLPDKYRFLLFEEKQEVELVWNGKTNEITNTVLPFQVIEQVDEPRSEKTKEIQGLLFGEELEISLSPPGSYSAQGGEWVKAKVAFRFWSGFPEIEIQRSGQEISDIERLIEELRQIVRGDEKEVDFYPLEPNYHLSVTRTDSDYDVVVILDATGSQKTGVYCGMGPAIHISTDSKGLLKFTDELEKELEQIKQIVQAK